MAKKNDKKEPGRKEIPTQAEQDALSKELDDTIQEMESGIGRLRSSLKRIQEKLGKLQQQLDQPESGEQDQDGDAFIWTPDGTSGAWSA